MTESDLLPTIQNILANSWAATKAALVVYGIGLGIEFFLPALRNQPLKDIMFNLVYTVIFVTVNMFVLRSTEWIVAPVVAWAGGPLLQFSLSDGIGWELLLALSFFAVFRFLLLLVSQVPAHFRNYVGTAQISPFRAFPERHDWQPAALVGRLVTNIPDHDSHAIPH